MEVRWHIYRRHLTVEAVKKYRDENPGCGMMEAQNKLKEYRKVLEVYDEKTDTWNEVPEITTFID